MNNKHFLLLLCLINASQTFPSLLSVSTNKNQQKDNISQSQQVPDKKSDSSKDIIVNVISIMVGLVIGVVLAEIGYSIGYSNGKKDASKR